MTNLSDICNPSIFQDTKGFPKHPCPSCSPSQVPFSLLNTYLHLPALTWTEIDDIKAGMRGVNILASVMRKDKNKQNMYSDTKDYKNTVSNWNNEDRIMLDDDGYSVILLRLKGSQIDTFERGNILQIQNVFARKDKEGMIYLETNPMSKIKKIGDDPSGVDFQGMRAGLYEWEI